MFESAFPLELANGLHLAWILFFSNGVVEMLFLVLYNTEYRIFDTEKKVSLELISVILYTVDV